MFMRKRNRASLFLVWPIVLFIWIIGWSLYWIGSKKDSAKPRETREHKELIFTMLTPEQEQRAQHNR
jgi:hypothetical protein